MNSKRPSVSLVLRALVLIALALAAPPRSEGQETIVPLRVENVSAWARVTAPVSFGVPLPRELAIRSAAELGVVDQSGRPVAAQGTVLSRWGGGPEDASKPIKWVLLDFQTSVPARGLRKFLLVRGGNPIQPAVATHVKDERTGIEISTGVATFRISRERFSLFDEIRLHDRTAGELLVARARESDGLEYRDPDSRRFRAGRPDSVRVEIPGPLHAVINVSGRFVDDSGRPSFLYYVARYHFHAGHREARLLLTVTDRHDRPVAEGQWDKRWDAQQVVDLRLALSLAEPARAVLLPRSDRSNAVDQHDLGSGRAHLRLTQLSPHSYRLSLANRDGESEQKGYMEVSGLNWLPRTDWKGFQGSDFLVQDADDGRSFVRWVAPVPEPGRYKVAVSLPEIPGFAGYLTAKGVTYEVRSSAGLATRVLDQDSSGWTSLGTFQFLDRAEVTLRATGKGKVVADALWIQPANETRRSPVVVDRDRAAGWTYALGRSVGMAVGLREFWQNAPKDLLVAQDGRIELGLLPGGPHHFMGGLGKTHEIVFSPRAVRPGETLDHVDGAFLGVPLHALAPAGWYARTGAVGYGLFHGDRGTTPEEREYETLIERAIDPEQPSLVTEIERRNWYGWRNYGDFEVGLPYWSADGAIEDWANGMMDYATGLLTQYLRTGRHPYWTLGRAAAWHVADIGLVKFHPFDPKSNGTVHRKGECPRSRSHVCQDPIAGQSFAHRSLLLLYQLTGDSWFLETALMNVDYVHEFSELRLGRAYFLPAAGREMGWILGGLLTGYEQTGKLKYLDLAKRLFETKVLKQYDAATHAIINLSVPNEYAPAQAPALAPWMVGYTGDALIYYYRVTNDARAAAMVVAQAQFLREFGIRLGRVPAKGEAGFLPVIPPQLAGTFLGYVLYLWTYEQSSKPLTVRAIGARGLTIYFDPAAQPVPSDLSSLKGKTAVFVTGRAAGKSFLILSAESGAFSVQCRRPLRAMCGDDVSQDGVAAGDRAVIIQGAEYQTESINYNFVVLNTLAFASRYSGDPGYLNLARELFAHATAHLARNGGYDGPRVASDYLGFPHLFLNIVAQGATKRAR